ncbi:MAG TPA: cytochrome c-type biogenesis protein [Pseudomonadales bacterium]|nr:cytochrome c-type biogenesis protein [Pseudomonadales bacterium]
MPTRMPIRGLRAPIALLLLLAVASGAFAAIDVHEFASAAEEARFKGLVDELRCPKCLNTNLSGSDSPIAADLRNAVARMVQEGRSDQEIRDYLVERYGDFILYRPRLTARTFLLWFGPGLLLLVGLGIIVLMVRRQLRRGDTTALDDDEQARLERLRARGALPDGPDTHA